MVSEAGETIDIGTRRELFVDELLIESMEGEARQLLRHPTPSEIIFVSDRPWEGNGLNYVTIFKDGELYKMYYRGGDYDRGGNRYTKRSIVMPLAKTECVGQDLVSEW